MSTQEIIRDFPPLYEEIDAAFGVAGRENVIFSFGDRLYVPRFRGEICPSLLAHEAVHGSRQGRGRKITDWWHRYIENRTFRLTEEILAHQAEYRYLLEHGNRGERRRALRQTAERLASPLYRCLVSRSVAEDMLRQGAAHG